MTFTGVGFYLLTTACLLAANEPGPVLVRLAMASVGVLMMLAGVGGWNRWRQLVVLCSFSLSLVALPVFFNQFRNWDMNWYMAWYYTPWHFVAAGAVALLVAALLRFVPSRKQTRIPPEHEREPAAPGLMTKLAVIVVAACACLYCGSYLLCSVQGRFEPMIIGLNGVKCYSWAPRGFCHEYKWNHKRERLYYGLWFLDTHLWHRSDLSTDSRYPKNEPADILDVYRAWKE
jgi:hypothetical protein